ncbi:MAG TPA: hypothetical protein VGE50_10660 [Gammaproteobacteria bacterium]
MTIDLSKLSAKELFELALRKEQEEQKQAQRQEQLLELQKQRALLMSAHQVALAEIERKISELTSQRGKLIAEHENTMVTIGREIGELTQQIQETERAERASKPTPAPVPAPAPKAATPPPPPPAPPKVSAPVAVEKPTPAAPPEPVQEAATSEEPSDTIIIDNKDELFEKIRDLMRTRSFISHGLLKEQLKVKGYNIPNLAKLVDQLIREGKLASAGGGNYALGKKA